MELSSLGPTRKKRKTNNGGTEHVDVETKEKQHPLKNGDLAFIENLYKKHQEQYELSKVKYDLICNFYDRVNFFSCFFFSTPV